LKELINAEWERNSGYEEDIFELKHSGAMVFINKRPQYCDRGHWCANVSGIPTLDHADSFPRYFMDFDTAKKEMHEWLIWRLYAKSKYQNSLTVNDNG
jgi:hypothetical protein